MCGLRYLRFYPILSLNPTLPVYKTIDPCSALNYLGYSSKEKLTLSVSPDIKEIIDFSFDIHIGTYVLEDLSVSIYTDKYTCYAGDIMHLGLEVVNPGGDMNVCFAIWVELPDSSIYLYMHMHDIVVPAGFSYSDPAFESITLPSLLSGTYTWHAAFLNPSTHEIIVEDTATWEFS